MSLRDFEERGFAVLPSAFSREDALAWREHIVGLGRAVEPRGGPRATLDLWQGVDRNRQLWPVIFHAPLVGAARALVGGAVRYMHNSEVHANNAGFLWHRDCLDQTRGRGPDWDDATAPYRLVRACIHLQTFEESGFRFGVVPGSHRAGARTLAGLAADARTRLRRRLRLGPPRRDPRRHPLPKITMQRGVLSRLRPATPTWIPVGLGDCILIHQRLLHSASQVHGPQYAIYFSYGPDDVHSHRQWTHYRHERRDRPQDRLAADLARQLDAAGLLSEYDRAELE